jgi:hypothetical protein
MKLFLSRYREATADLSILDPRLRVIDRQTVVALGDRISEAAGNQVLQLVKLWVEEATRKEIARNGLSEKDD